MTTIDRSNFKVLYLDASAYSESSCLKKLQYIISDGLRPLQESSALSYGTAIHKFIAHLRSSDGDLKASLKIALDYYVPYSLKLKEKDFRTIEHLILSCNVYYKTIFPGDLFKPIKRNGVAQIEQKFAFSCTEMFPELQNDLDNEQLIIILCGTVDEIGVLENNNITIKDIKTSTSWNVAEYLNGYSTSTQMLFYVMIVEHLLKLKNVGVFIEGVFLQKDKPTVIQRSDVIDFSDKQRESFKRQLFNTLNGIIYNSNNEDWQENYTLCNCSKFQSETVGKCSFFKLCGATSNEVKDSYLKSFNRINYEPLKFDEQKL